MYCNAVDLTGDAELASFPSALADSSAVGTCADGYYGQPRLTCQSNGEFDLTSLVNACNGACIGLARRTGDLSQTRGQAGLGRWGEGKDVRDP